MVLKINYPKALYGRRMIRRWERSRDLGALIDMLEHNVIPRQLIQALRDYRDVAGTTSLEALLFGNRRGRGGNAAARSAHQSRSDCRYAAVLAARRAGWRDGAEFTEAAKFLVERGMAPAFTRLTPADRAARLRSLDHRRRKKGPLDPFLRQWMALIAGLLPRGPRWMSPISQTQWRKAAALQQAGKPAVFKVAPRGRIVVHEDIRKIAD